MASKFSNSAATLALGMAFLVTPALMDTTSFFAIDSAFAAKGGNGNGNSGGNGNGNSGGNGGSKSEKSISAKAEKTEKASKSEKASNGSLASKLGALNAAHASTKALANASPNSKVGKIAIYKEANAAAVIAQEAVTTAQEAATTAAADAAAAQLAWEQAVTAANDPELAQAVIDAQLAVDGAPGDLALEQALLDAQKAVTDANDLVASTLVTKDEKALLSTTAAEAVIAAEDLAAAAEATALTALEAAANKPVDDEGEVKAAVDALLLGK